MLNHEGEAVSSKHDLFLGGSNSSILILAGQGNVGLHSVVNGALGDFEALVCPHSNVNVLPLSVRDRVCFH